MDTELDDRLTRFARTPLCSAASISPDGRRVAFCSELSGLRQAWTVDAGGGWPQPVTALDDPVMDVSWSPDGRWLALVVAPGGGMHTQVHVARPDGTDLRRLTRGGTETNTASGWSRRGELLLTTNERSAGTMDAMLADPETGERRVVADLGGVGGIADVSPDGRLALLGRMRQRGDADAFTVDLETGVETPLTPHEGQAISRPACFAPDGRSIYLVTDIGRERQALARVPAGGGPLEILAERGDADLARFAVSPDHGHAALVWSAGGRFEIELMDLATGRREPGPEPPAETVGSVSLSDGAERMAILAVGPAMPRNVWTWDRASGMRQATNHVPAGVDLSALARPELVRFPAHDGLELSAWLYRAGDGPGPLVLQFHGGPEAQELAVFSPLYQSLVAAGIAVLAANVRGSSGFGKTFVNLDNGALRFDAVRDIRACADFAVGAGIAAPGRLGIMGASYGGFMTTAGITEHPDLFAAAATVAGIVNFETFFANTEPWMAAISKVEYGDPDTEADLLRRLSPIHRMDRARAATLVVHGANDTNVPVVEAEQVVETLRRRGVPVEYLLFADEGHGFTRTANITTYTAAMVRWFQRHL
ncbi:MAG TPA: S9 family peptidase [Candidatus Dormibacteraeota bacterium]